MIAYLVKQILPLKGAPHTALPSIRELAERLHSSPLTIHRVLKDLAKKKLVYAQERKGYFWGSGPRPFDSSLLQPTPSRQEELRVQLLEDYKNGTLNPFEKLPLQKELCLRYKCSISTLKLVLNQLQQDLWIIRKGRIWYFSNSRPLGIRKKILLVLRCDAQGKLLLETDRELEFMRSCYQEIARRNFEISVLGWDESSPSPRFLDQYGQAIVIEESRYSFFGILVSTWLVQQYKALLTHLRKKKVPISVWWEHSLNTRLIETHKSNQIAYFNLAFGRNPGKLVALHLLSKNIQNVIFLSPFHASEWSRNRLIGIEQVVTSRGLTLRTATDKTVLSPWEIQQQAWKDLNQGPRKYPFEHPKVVDERDRKITQMIRNLLEAEKGFPSNTAIVAVNDLVASLVFPLLHDKSVYLVSFDNSSVSMRLQFTSFAFNTVGMVRNMLHHLIQPKDLPYSNDEFQEIEGWVEEKSNAFF